MPKFRLYLAIGLVLSLSSAVPSPVAAEPPTFSGDVAPILYRHCVECHRPGDIAPFSLLTYEDASRRAGLIASATATHRMPPWKPEPDYGDFQGVRRLADGEIATLRAWANEGVLRGDVSQLPTPPVSEEGWRLGTPDRVLEMPTPFTIPAGGSDIYQCFVLPLDLAEDAVLSAVEFRPGTRAATHHSVFFMDTRRIGRWRDGGSEEPGYRCFGGVGVRPTDVVGGWTPGATPTRLPEGVGRVLKKGSDLVIQNHYHPTDRIEVDQSSVGLYFSKSPVEKTVFGFPLGKPDFLIPAGAKRHRVASSFVTPIDLEVIGLSPHMHLLGSEIRVTATLPDGTVRPMIWIRQWDFNWQSEHTYTTPMRLPKGTRIDVESFYDNSVENPRNPNRPPQPVRWGESTTDEMNVVLVHCQTPHPGDELSVLWDVAMQQPAWVQVGVGGGRR